MSLTGTFSSPPKGKSISDIIGPNEPGCLVGDKPYSEKLLSKDEVRSIVSACMGIKRP